MQFFASSSSFLRSLVASAVMALSACGGGGSDGGSGFFLPPAERTVGSVRLIGEQLLANDLKVDGFVVGGLSGVDYDPVTGTWYFLSDDRTASRFHTAELKYDATSFSSIQIRSSVTLKDASGKPYVTDPTPGAVIADPESFRVDPQDGALWWGSEGDRGRSLDPFVAKMGKDGKMVASLPSTPMFKMFPTENKGSRNNATFEALSFSADGKSLWVGMEAPIYEDGPLPTVSSGAVSRFTQYDRAGTVLRQVAYPIDAFPAAPAAGKSADNGVSEMLAINDHQFLVIERAGVQGADDAYVNYIRLYEIDTTGATDVRGLASLTGTDYKPVQKRLVLNLNTLGLKKLDNIEGMTWGPKLANGHDTLVLVSDNNFNAASQITQVLAFEVTGK